MIRRSRTFVHTTYRYRVPGTELVSNGICNQKSDMGWLLDENNYVSKKNLTSANECKRAAGKAQRCQALTGSPYVYHVRCVRICNVAQVPTKLISASKLDYTAVVACTIRAPLGTPHSSVTQVLVMRQGRRSEATEVVFCL